MKNSLIVALVIIAVAILGGIVFFSTFKRDWVTETTQASGEARYNRFFALENILENLDQPASSGVMLGRVLPRLRPGDTLVIGDDTGRIDPSQAEALRAWVRGGGQLVISPSISADREVPLFDGLGLLRSGSKRERFCVKLAAGTGSQSDAQTALLCSLGFYLQPQALAHASVVIGDQDGKGLVFARVPEGKGVVSLLGNMDIISDNHLKHAPEQQFAQRLLAPNFDRGHFYLLYDLIGNSFWVNLFVRGWPALLASLLLALGWMAMRSERLGPLASAPAAHRRALLEHIQAVGEFLFRRDGGRSLHRLACEAIRARLHRSDPASAMLDDQELYSWLAQRSRLEPSHIEHAFRSPVNAAAFRGSVTTLARLRSHL
jgi:hypothetical protein